MFRKILLPVFIIILLISNSCKEEINEPCGEDITITIITKYKACGDEECLNIADETEIQVYQNENNNTVILLDSGVTNTSGEYQFTPKESGCGINNLTIYGQFDDEIQFADIDYVCNDTIIEFCFEIGCADTIPPNDCNDLNKTDSLNFNDNVNGDCIDRDAPDGNNYYRMTATFCNSDLTNDIRISGINNLPINFNNGKFRLSRAIPSSNANGEIILNQKNKCCRLIFEVLTDEVGTYAEQYNLQTVCSGNTGTWEISLDAEICEPECNCPFNQNEPYEIDFDETVEVGTSHAFNNIEVFQIGFNAFQDGCYLEIDEIVRIDEDGNILTNDAYTYNQGNEWIITSSLSNQQYESGDRFVIDAEFSPDVPQTLRDTFRVNTTVYDADGNVVDPDCEYEFILEANGCQDGCAFMDYDITVTEDLVVKRINTQGVTDIWDDNLFEIASTPQTPIQLSDYYNYDEVMVRFNSDYSSPNLCGMNSVNIKEFDFIFYLDEQNEYCTLPQNYEITSINTGDDDSNIDSEYFTFTPIFGELETPDSQFGLNVEFNAPSYIELENLWDNGQKTNQDNIFKLRLNVYDEVHNCHIVLNFQAEVTGVPGVSPRRSLNSFNQISDKTILPAQIGYEAAYILKKQDNFFGKMENHSISDTKYPGTDPAHNSPDGDQTFYINVDRPKNYTIGSPQNPELYLVSTDDNIFDKITQEPIAHYNSVSEFSSGLSDLIDDVFSGNAFSQQGSNGAPSITFNYDPTVYGWRPYWDKMDFEENGGQRGHPNGIDNLLPGQVYIIWSTNGYYNYSGNEFSCNVAFLFIQSVYDDHDQDASHVAGIDWRIVYPVFKTQ